MMLVMARLRAPSARCRLAYWREMRRGVRWLYFSAWWLASLGLLARPGAASRWVTERCEQLEHGLRCLLVLALGGQLIGTPSVSRSDIDQKPAPDNNEPGQAIYDQYTDIPYTEYRDASFGLSLKALGHAMPGPHKGLASAPANRKARRPISPEIRLAIRLRILANAFAEPDIQIARMRQRLARLGLIVRKLGPTFPETITTTLLRMGAERSGINLPARLLFDSS